jgi:5-formyltetrahydrofolate cyclo-ligase
MSESKALLRKRLIQEREVLSPKEVERRSLRVFKTFENNLDRILPPSFSTVALYYSVRGEVDTRIFFDFFLSKGKTCLFPKIEKSKMSFYEVKDWADLRDGSFGIAEPLVTPDAAPIKPDVLIVPGVGFARNGHRLGFGAGFYDRTIDAWTTASGHDSVVLIGVAYDFQLIEDFPHEAHDHPMDFVLLEDQLIVKE